jgi:hypothetical protein
MLLLGHLAQFASFYEQGELLCTQGLAYLLQDHRAKSKFAAWIRRRAHTKLKGELTWLAEAHQESDHGRPDLEARIGEDMPVVKIEAKLGAKLGMGQLRSYAHDLQKRGPANTILLVMVPRYRIAEAEEVVLEAFGLSGHSPWRPAKYSNVSVAVITWEEVLAVLAKSGPRLFRSDLEQLRAMHRVLNGDNIVPVDPKELDKWRKRERVFNNLVDRVTRLMKLKTDHNRSPMGPEKLSEGGRTTIYYRRYVGRPYGKEKEPSTCFSIGVRDPFIKHKTPIWLRFHKDTPHFSEVRDRLLSSKFKEKKGLNRSGGHIWIPLHVKFKAGTDQMVNDLIRQAQEVLKIAFKPTL